MGAIVIFKDGSRGRTAYPVCTRYRALQAPRGPAGCIFAICLAWSFRATGGSACTFRRFAFGAGSGRSPFAVVLFGLFVGARSVFSFFVPRAQFFCHTFPANFILAGRVFFSYLAPRIFS